MLSSIIVETLKSINCPIVWYQAHIETFTSINSTDNKLIQTQRLTVRASGSSVCYPRKMYSLFFILVWRRKLLFLCGSLLCLIGIWIWAIYYTTSLSRLSDKIMTVQDFDAHREQIIAKYGFGASEADRDGVRFVRPTDEMAAPNAVRSQESSIRLRERSFSSFFLNKDAAKVLQNLDSPSRDEIAQHRAAQRQSQAATRQTQYEHELHRMGIPVVAGLGPGGPNAPKQRLVHLDLKGAPPKISYLKRLLPIVKSLGATGLLIEYEDMFPFSGTIASIAARNAYTDSDIRELLHAIAVTGLSVMPLIQTFGHLEFALKLKDFEHLREVPESPQSLCPSRNESVNFVEKMIEQVVVLHQPQIATNSTTSETSEFLTPNFTHLHIGCDEVYRMGECMRCKSKDRNELFLSHVRTVARFVRRRWPHIKVVIWDDMLRQIQLGDLQNSQLSALVEPMVWVYAEDIYRFVSMQTWDKYAQVFPTVWTASAFKGAHGETLILPPARRHLENNMKWLTVINAETSRFTNGIMGLALTGWQRYDHFAVLCELLPVSIPSLAISLSTVSKGYFDTDLTHNHILAALTCSEPSESQRTHRPWLEMGRDPELLTFAKCMFPGSQTLRYVIRLTNSITDARHYLENVNYKRGWLTAYNIRHNFSSPIRIDELISDAVRLEAALTALAKNAADSLIDVFDKWTIDEYIEQTIMPMLDELQKLQEHAKQLMAMRVWPRRPLPYYLTKNAHEKRNNVD